jgi:hypothetical protein
MADYLLKEDGDKILLEGGGGSLLLESSTPGGGGVPVIVSTLSTRKDGILEAVMTNAPSGSDSITIDCRGAVAVEAISDVAITWRMYDEVLNDGTSYRLQPGDDVEDGGAGTAGRVNNPPPVVTIRRAGGNPPGRILYYVIYNRRRIYGR